MWVETIFKQFVKQPETTREFVDKHLRIMCIVSLVLCIVYAGFSLFQVVYDATGISSARFIDDYLSDAFMTDADIALFDVLAEGSTGGVSSVKQELLYNTAVRNLIFDIIGLVVSLLAGISIFVLLKHIDASQSKKSFIDVVTTDNEKLVITSLEKAGGVLTQSELVSSTGLTKVKVHRIIKRLEGLGLVSKYPFGMTNKVRLEKNFSKK